MTDQVNDMFDERKIQKAIKKGKYKTILKMVLISLLVFIIGNVVNFFLLLQSSQKTFEAQDAYVRLTTPNGYISETVDSLGFFSGMSTYKISKDMKIKSVMMEERKTSFGILPSILVSRGAGGSIGVTGDVWQNGYKENGWRKLMFFHPAIAYQKYPNDQDVIQNLGEHKLYEVALSFDQPYSYRELASFNFPKISWYWLNTYTEEETKTWQQEAFEHDWSSTFISEFNIVGLQIREGILNEFDYAYEEFLTLLPKSFDQQHHQVYEMLKEKDPKDVDVLGVVVYGDKEEILNLINQPFVKAASLGGVIDYY